MNLIGQYDSPFVRRVAIALRLYDLPFEHRPWSTFGDGDRIAAFNPLHRVPTLVLDNGETLIESAAILDHLDELVGPPRAMIFGRGDLRRHAPKVCALATGLADRARRLGGRPGGQGNALLVRRLDRSRRHRGCLRAALHVRRASRAV
jgi:glutathione S-transferase